ncbi:MAG: DUF4358 domain-containing protein [Clostridia bacterium]|nr:DUF4358 domain-containing protein [Clostridia bacterium]
MKKMIAVLAALTMLLSVSACGKGSSDPGSTDLATVTGDDVVSVSCEGIYSDISAVVNFPEMVSVQPKSLSNRYGIEQNMYNDYVFMTAQEATLCDTVIIVNTNSRESKDAVIEKLELFIKQSRETNVDYNPDQYEIIKDASVKTSGDYVYLVFSSDSTLIEEMIKERLQ